MSIERADERRGKVTRSVKLPGKEPIKTAKDPVEIALEIRAARLTERAEALRK